MYIPDYWCERILVYRGALSTDNPKSENYFEDPFVRQRDSHRGRGPVRAGWKVAEGTAYAQEDRVGVHRKTPTVSVDAVSFFNVFFIIQDLDKELPPYNSGDVSRESRLYLWRLDEPESVRVRYTVVLIRPYPNGATHVYVTDPREGRSSSVSPQ